ncbi:hypothetical protein IV203_011583 [Nitzschia inconspicua]|uniref:Exostosin GT47 domain-containing protein n=1 Tax=Nitzschia inconspicua TaxID=303405 RepID=A0A9K3PJF2_9STRA|nr:hypothetical protein IV203_011583 [Nitzschia inconspicua]
MFSRYNTNDTKAEFLSNSMPSKQTGQIGRPPVIFHRFHELTNETIPEKFENGNLYTTAFSSASRVIVNETAFFRPRRICQSTCCMESIAISLDQDDHHIINTLDGTDLADVYLQQYRNAPFIQFFGSILHPDLLPCLQPGTILHIDNYPDLLGFFFNELRPKINVSYVMITSETDLTSPLTFHESLSNDHLMLKWFGTNPTTLSLTDVQTQRFEAMPLGLAKFHEQSRLLTPYLERNNYANPFRYKERWTYSVLMTNRSSSVTNAFDDDELFYKTVFVQFGRHQYASRVRFTLWEDVCNGISATKEKVALLDNISCENTRATPRDVYRAASKYLFGFSPAGAGPDCYRTYELLLLGVIPIVGELPVNWGGLFDDLPVLVVPDLDKKHTRSEYLEIVRQYILSPEFQSNDFEKGWEKLFLRYWRRRVLKEAGRNILLDPATGKEYYEGWKYTSTNSSAVMELGIPKWYAKKE